jgi:3-oxoadipate enol-lactonase
MASGLHVEVHGSADADPVLLIMGLGMTGAMWGPLVPGLAARHPVATFDHRALGRSPGPAADSMAALADDTLSVLDGLGWARAHVVGISMGGMIAQELALRAPERTRTLTLMATHAGGPLGLVPPLLGIAAILFSMSRTSRLERLLYPRALRGDVRPRTEAMIAQGVPASTLRAHLRAVRTHDTRARLARLAVPTLVVKPDLDALVRPSHSDRLAAGIPGARLHRMPDVGHGLVTHRGEALAALLLAHFAQG